MKNITQVSESYLCSNCGACSVICPKEAVEFKWTNIGRLHADVNSNCVDCGKCLKVCPSIDENNIHSKYKDRYVGDIQTVWVGRATDERIFQNAQSGGVATSVLTFLFENGLIDAAIVCRMSFGSIPYVEPCLVTSKDQLLETQKSCYTPVSLLTKLKEARRYGRVAIVGLPCHIQGVESLMMNSSDFSNVKYRIGLICDRTECNEIQTVIKSLTGQNDFKIEWKSKYDHKLGQYNYIEAPIAVLPREGSPIVVPRRIRFDLKDMFTPPRCFVCWDKLNVFSDITLGDPWRLANVNETEGESLVIARTGAGADLLSSMCQANVLSLRQVDKDAPIHSQLIAERKQKVSDFSHAFSVLSPSIKSYLLCQYDDAFPQSGAAEKVLRRFVINENKSREEIVRTAKSVLSHQERSRRRKSLVRKVRGKILKRLVRLCSFFG